MQCTGHALRFGLVGLILMTFCHLVLPAQSTLSQLLGVAALAEKPIFVNQQPKPTDFPDFESFCENGDITMFHSADLDNDGDQDLIFNGPCTPYNHVIIYLNQKGKLNQVWDSPGEVIGIPQDEEGAEILVWNEGCCCEFYNSAHSIHFQKSAAKPIVESLMWHQDIEIEADFFTKSLMASGIFRTIPLIDDIPKKAVCDDEMLIGNQDFVLKSPTNAYQIAIHDGMQLIAVEVSPQSWKLGWQQLKKEN